MITMRESRVDGGELERVSVQALHTGTKTGQNEVESERNDGKITTHSWAGPAMANNNVQPSHE